MSTSTATADPAARERLAAHLDRLDGKALLIGLDVDGTLVDHDGRMTPAMRAALVRAAP